MQKRSVVGVIIGRFQVPELHAGHRFIIDRVQEMHAETLIIIGSARSYPTPRNPLDFITRKAMIEQAYPGITVAELRDQRHDDVWSVQLDKLIADAFPERGAILYGSRESFIPYYTGMNICITLESPLPEISATEMRQQVLRDPIASEAFRSGMVYAASNRKPISYQTVDIAIVNFDRKQLLLGGRAPEKGKLRFIGGFVDATDASLEMAAKREVREEANGIEVANLKYLGSHRVNDWRYADSSDGIMTAFFIAHFIFGAAQPTDDIDIIEWVPWDDFLDRLVEEHKPLGEQLITHLTGIKPTKGA